MYFVYIINYNFYGNENKTILVADKDLSNKITEFKNINLNEIKTNIQPKKENEYTIGITFKFDSYTVKTLEILEQFLDSGLHSKSVVGINWLSIEIIFI